MLLPLLGSFLFILFYLLATLFYPGGSQADAQAKGFSWLHNYWCNLLNEYAINRQPNNGRPYALAASFFLSLTLLAFWLVAVRQLAFSKLGKRIVLSSGLIALALLPFLSTTYHDTVINVAASFGLLSMAMIYRAVYTKGWRGLFYFGLFNVVLVAINNYIYHFAGSLYWLPLVQKITFLSFLGLGLLRHHPSLPAAKRRGITFIIFFV